MNTDSTNPVTLSERKKVVAIVGGHSHNTSEEAMGLAESVGRLAAESGLIVATGGFDGIMEAALRGAKKAGGTTMAVLKGNDKSSANRYADICIATSLDLAFMHVLVWTADVIVAFEGNYGTLTEIALALETRRPLVMVGIHRHLDTTAIPSDSFLHLPNVSGVNQTRLVSYFKRYAIL